MGFQRNTMGKDVRIIIKSADKVVGVKFRKIPEIGDEIILAYNGKNNLIRIAEIREGNPTQIYAEEI